jgi:hypothetical protein
VYGPLLSCRFTLIPVLIIEYEEVLVPAHHPVPTSHPTENADDGFEGQKGTKDDSYCPKTLKYNETSCWEGGYA